VSEKAREVVRSVIELREEGLTVGSSDHDTQGEEGVIGIKIVESAEIESGGGAFPRENERERKGRMKPGAREERDVV